MTDYFNGFFESTQICDKRKENFRHQQSQHLAALLKACLGSQRLLAHVFQSPACVKTRITANSLCGGLGVKIMQPSHEMTLFAKARLHSSSHFLPTRRQERNAISAHFIDVESEAEGFKITCLVQETFHICGVICNAQWIGCGLSRKCTVQKAQTRRDLPCSWS